MAKSNQRNPNLYYTTPVYHTPIDEEYAAITIIPSDEEQHVISHAGTQLGEVTVAAIEKPYVNVSDSTVTAATVAKGEIAYDKEGNQIIGEMEPSSGEGVDVTTLNYIDTPKENYYVYKVDETNGIIDVERRELPQYNIPTNTSDLVNDSNFITSNDIKVPTYTMDIEFTRYESDMIVMNSEDNLRYGWSRWDTIDARFNNDDNISWDAFITLVKGGEGNVRLNANMIYNIIKQEDTPSE